MEFAKHKNKRSLPHPIIRAAINQYSVGAVIDKLGLCPTSSRVDKIFHNPKKYMTLEQIENFAGFTNVTFYELLEGLRGKDLQGKTAQGWFKDA